MRHPILLWPHPTLKKISEPFQGTYSDTPESPSDAKSLRDDLFETMYGAKGAGLAAPQIGKSVRVMIVDVSDQVADVKPVIMFNPEIVSLSGKQISQEGCLSIPGFQSDLDRASTVVVKFKTVTGEFAEETFTGLMATAIQHEFDHLNGIVFVDKLSPLKRDIARRKTMKIKKELERFNEEQAKLAKLAASAKATVDVKTTQV